MHTVNRLVDTIHLALTIGNTTQTSTGQKTQRPRDNTSLVTNDITKQVTGDDNPVQLARVLNHNHSRRVNQLMPDLHLRELLSHHLRHNLPPQPTRREDVGLVQTPHGERRVVLQGQVCGETGDALDFGARVRLGVEGVAAAVVFLSLAEVDTTGQFTDDVEVDATADVGSQGGAFDEGGGGKVAGTKVAEGGHFFAQFEDTLFWADGAGSPFLIYVVISAVLVFLMSSTS